MHKEKSKILIGRREFISFPDFGLKDIEAKIDTGAYTSALYCNDIMLKKNTEGKECLCFKVLGPAHPYYNSKEFCFEEFIQKEIKNSFGDIEKRFIIKTRIKIGKKICKSSISLTDRGNMRYPVLLGRRILKNRFIVDVSGLNLTIQKLKY